MEENSMRIVVPVQRSLEFKVNRWMVKLGFHWHHEVNSGIELYWEKNGQRYTQLQAIVMYVAVKNRWKFWK